MAKKGTYSNYCTPTFCLLTRQLLLVFFCLLCSHRHRFGVIADLHSELCENVCVCKTFILRHNQTNCKVVLLAIRSDRILKRVHADLFVYLFLRYYCDSLKILCVQSDLQHLFRTDRHNRWNIYIWN